MATHHAIKRVLRTPAWKQSLLGRFVTHRLPANETGIELTFDDGPNPNVTPAVLERLARYDIRATFFVLGRNVLRHRSTLRQIHASGHRIANHSLTHPRFRHLDYRTICKEIRSCQHAVEDALGVTPTLFRPPFGRITPTVLLAAKSTGLKIVNWSLDSGDWRCRDEHDAQRCATETAELVQPRDILLFHDNHNWITSILDQLLPKLAARGFVLNATGSPLRHVQ
jgi:peptidoglycan-N-acetylglucosamine deacetylase